MERVKVHHEKMFVTGHGYIPHSPKLALIYPEAYHEFSVSRRAWQGLAHSSFQQRERDTAASIRSVPF